MCVCLCVLSSKLKGKFERWRLNHRVGFRVRGKLRREKRLDRLGEQGTDTKGERDSWHEQWQDWAERQWRGLRLRESANRKRACTWAQSAKIGTEKKKKEGGGNRLGPCFVCFASEIKIKPRAALLEVKEEEVEDFEVGIWLDDFNRSSPVATTLWPVITYNYIQQPPIPF